MEKWKVDFRAVVHVSLPSSAVTNFVIAMDVMEGGG
jgi:hypothetical protein